MNFVMRSATLGLFLGLSACGGGGSGTGETLNTDYSSLRIAESRDSALVNAGNSEQVLAPLRNGLRLSLESGQGGILLVAGVTAPIASDERSYSGTTVQVEGVDEADLVKYDGRYIYMVRQELLDTSLSRNVLEIVRTDPASAGTELVAEFSIEGEQSMLPLLYEVRTQTGGTQYLAAVSQNFFGWFLPQPLTTSLAVQPDRTTIQLLDVRDPYNVSQAWKIELDGWLRASRKIGDTLYLVSNYRPRLAGFILPADTTEKREANERRIRNATASDLLPHYRENGGALRQLAQPDECVIAADLANNEGYTDLVVITAINLAARRVTDVSCLSTNVSGVYVSTKSLYVGGTGHQSSDGSAFTVLHKFALDEGQISYRASGSVIGEIGWRNASYYMDERADDLRIVTTKHAGSGDNTHHLSVLRHGDDRRLSLLSTLPNAGHPAPIGKPREQVHAVRFCNDRAYVVTARITDPLYVIDLRDPATPVIAGELEIPGFATYLRPIGPPQSQLLLSIGQQTNAAGMRQGVKVELFDVRDISRPQSLAVRVFGEAGSYSEAIDDPHALAFVTLPGTAPRHRLALPIDVYDTPDPVSMGQFLWSYSGMHLLEISGVEQGAAQLHFQGVLRTQERSDSKLYPSYLVPSRAVLHDDSVFAVHGDTVLSRLW